MSTKGIIQASLEFWGSIICLILLLTSMLDKEYKGDSKRYLLALYTSVGLTLLFDALAWIFRGRPGLLGSVMVYVSNFMVFQFNYIVLMAYTLYVKSNLPEEGQRNMQPFIRFLLGACAVMMGMTVANIWTHWFYFIDAQNFYHRNSCHWMTQIVGLFGTIINGVFLLKYRKRIEKGLFIAMFSYIVLPTIALATLVFYYGLSLLHVAMCISMVCMFIAAFKSHYMRMTARERELGDMKTQLLISQIEPHFLYNSLTTIKYLCRTSPDQAADAVDEFSLFLRANLDGISATKCIPFRAEVEQVCNYLLLEQRRFGERLNVTWDIEDEDFLIPSLTLQPIVENAVRHGIMKKPEGGTIAIRSSFLPEGFVIVVEDDGVGFDIEQVARQQKEAESTGRHLGLRNVKSRLELMRGGAMLVESEIGKGTTVKLILPEE